MPRQHWHILHHEPPCARLTFATDVRHSPRCALQGWRPEMCKDQEDAAAFAALLPSWVPLAAAAEDDAAERPAATPGAEEGEAAHVPEGGEEAANGDAPDGEGFPSGTGNAVQSEDASAEPAVSGLRPTFADAGTGPAEPRSGGADRRHVVVDAPLWPRLVGLDPEIPGELARAGVTVHLVTESRVRQHDLKPHPHLTEKLAQQLMRLLGSLT